MEIKTKSMSMEPGNQNITSHHNRKPGHAPCKKHPKHRQSPGVCSICLSERLSQLPNIATTSGSKTKDGVSSSVSSSSSSSSSSSELSSNASSCSTPVTCRVEYLEAGKVFKNVGQNVLKKSRSMAFVLQRRKEASSTDETSFNGKRIDVKRRFWSKFLPTRGKGLRHSRTMRERVIMEVR